MKSKNTERDIDFLAVYNRRDKKSIDTSFVKWIILPLVLVLAFGSAFGYFTIKNKGLQNDIDNLNIKLQEELAKAGNAENNEKVESEAQLKTELANLQLIDTNLASYPQISKGVLDSIRNSCDKVTLSSIAYDQSSGAIDLEITASNVSGCQEAVRLLRGSPEFTSVEYSGYSQSGGTSESQQTVTDPVTGQTTTQTVSESSPIIYSTSVSCILGGQ